MNKKELMEIRRNFSDECAFFNIYNVVMFIIGKDRETRYVSKRRYDIIPCEDSELIMSSLKQVLSGKLGDKISEYKFLEEAYNEDGAQKFLHRLYESRFTDDDIVNEYVKRVANNVNCDNSYLVISAVCDYNYIERKKKSEKDNSGADTQTHSFIITALCPVEINIDELVYDESNNNVSRKAVADNVIEQPTDGFVFPTFSDRKTDVNSVLYYNKNANKPNISIVNNLLGCKYFLSSKDEKKTFKEMLNTVVEEDMDFDMITEIYQALKDDVALNYNQTEQAIINENKLKQILWESGVPEDKLEDFHSIYETYMGNNQFRTTNLCEDKMTIESDGVVVSVDDHNVRAVDIGVVDGVNSIVIKLNSSHVYINGIDTVIK